MKDKRKNERKKERKKECQKNTDYKQTNNHSEFKD